MAKMKKLEIILTDCIDDIKSGKSTVAECLNHYSSNYPELGVLLQVAMKIQLPETIKLDDAYKQTAKAQLLRSIASINGNKTGKIPHKIYFRPMRQFVWARVSAFALVISMLLSGMTAGAAYASQESLPGDALYVVKTSIEDMRLLVAGDNTAKSYLNLQFAQIRLEEMNKLASGNQRATEMVLSAYSRNLESAMTQIQTITNSSRLSLSLDTALKSLKSQMSFCDSIIDANPEYVEPVKEASALTMREQIRLMTMLEAQNNILATQSTLDGMQNRLQRSSEAAASSQFQVMQETLLQYEQFRQLGEEIMQRARINNNNYSIVSDLNLNALSDYTQRLNHMASEAPQEQQNIIQDCQQLTSSFATQAQYKYQSGNAGSQESAAQTAGNNGGANSPQNNPSISSGQTGSVDTGNAGNQPSSPAPATPQSTAGITLTVGGIVPAGNTSSNEKGSESSGIVPPPNTKRNAGNTNQTGQTSTGHITSAGTVSTATLNPS